MLPDIHDQFLVGQEHAYPALPLLKRGGGGRLRSVTYAFDDEALADFTRAISMDPAYAWAFSNRGRVLWALDRHDDAIADFTRAIELNPRYARALGSRGLGYLLTGRYDEALAT